MNEKKSVTERKVPTYRLRSVFAMHRTFLIGMAMALVRIQIAPAFESPERSYRNASDKISESALLKIQANP